MRKTLLTLLISAVLASGCTQTVETPALLPLPSQVSSHTSTYTLRDGYGIDCQDAKLNFIADYTSRMIHDLTGVSSSPDGEAGLRLTLTSDSLQSEGYRLRIGRKGIDIEAASPAGIFYGVQTLRQLLPRQEEASTSCTLHGIDIQDSPRFGWRGLHLDVSRHFFTVDEIKRFIDVMAMYKFNRFHWHLTDDQGWRIEIRSHPELTRLGAWREGIGFPENEKLAFPTEDVHPYGGFYTQEQIRDVVAYAAERMIEILPEIDLPGHSTAAIHALPELFCRPDKRLAVWMHGGVSEGVMCAGRESTYAILEDILGEVCALFPFEYIHLGGDEAPKKGWEKCPQCQARIRAEGLANENELQAYFMHRLEKFVNSRGKRMIGWDEIMEGGLSPTATVMSWRGVLPGLEAARGGNDVVMAPGSYLYLNHPQSYNRVTNTSEGILSLKRVYGFDPAPEADLTPEARAHILGVQACQWSECTPNEQILYYKEYPRAIAVAEMGWTAQADRNWEDFQARLKRHLGLLSLYGIPYGAPSRELQIALVPDAAGKPCIRISAETDEPIHYTLDGSEPTQESPVYEGPVAVSGDCTVRAQIFADAPACPAEQTIHFHKALCKPVSYALPYSTNHDGGGDFAMTDGCFEKWQGFEKQDADFTLDLGRPTTIDSIRTRWMYDISDWVLRPREVTFSISEDGKSFTELLRRKLVNPEGQYDKGVEEVSCPVGGRPVRFIRVEARSEKVNPAWHSSAGAPCWIFIDEVVVE